MTIKNILIITGTRADYGLLKPLIYAMAKSKKLSFKLFVTGAHTLKKLGTTLKEIEKDKFPIGATVKISEKDDMLQSLCKEISGIRSYCIKNKPDLVLVHGDRDEALAGAIVAGHLKIPIAHISGGDITGPFGVDEAIRHSITKFSHLHFPINKKAYERILRLGEDKQRVFNVGALALDNLSQMKFLTKAELAKQFNLDAKKKWFLIVHHPTPLEDIPFVSQIQPLLKTVSAYNSEKIIIYPNSDTGSEVFVREIEKCKHDKSFHIFKNLPRMQYLNFLNNVDLMLGNSSSGIGESTFFHLPTVNIGGRQGARDRSTNVINCGYSSNDIGKSIRKVSSAAFLEKCKKAESVYGSGNSAPKIIKILEKEINRPDLFYKKNNL
jgi:GDP/UDP-N,N'-diacetylbacillosamine 2-epimerase (hydrolysing)